jgi:MSHA biogenesis protein MshG
MYSMAKAGIPLDKALNGIEKSLDNYALRRILQDLVSELEKGMALTDAMSRHPKYFSPLYLSLVHVGENTGRLDLAFEQVGKYLDLERDTRKQIKSATRYPIFVIAAIAVALAVITMFVIPVFAETFFQLGAELPWQTVVLINISAFTLDYWYYILGFIAGSFFGFRYYVSTRQGRLAWDKRKLKLPLIGSIFDRVALSRFARTFSMMMKAGVPIVQALGVISRAVGNFYVGENVKRMRDSISKGDSLYKSAQKTGMFSPLVMQMIAVGEESGNIDELLAEVADFYDSEIEYDLKRLSSAIEPILIIFIAGMVLVLALGVFLPIWDLASAAN